MSETLTALDTPALILDMDKAERNVARLTKRLDGLGVTLRPHVKTAKSIDVVRRLFQDQRGPITVSTVKEAEYFAADGFTDITYAVGISPDKIARVVTLCERGADVKVVIDTADQALALAATAPRARKMPGVLIEIDCDGHRGGLVPGDRNLAKIASILRDAALDLRGVLTHAGESYGCRNGEGLTEAAEAERAAAVGAAELLRAHGHACPVVSVGSTPTAHFARDLSGVSEVRAGVFMFFDLVMHGIGVCEIDDIALSVLATVIGHKSEKGWILVDGGWMALSRDRGTARDPIDQGYGLVCDVEGRPYPNLIVSDVSQEHGIISVRPGSTKALPHLSGRNARSHFAESRVRHRRAARPVPRDTRQWRGRGQLAARPRLVIHMHDRIALINADELPRPGGHYSHAVRFGDFVFVSGQLGMRPDGSHTAHLPFDEQVQQALENMLTALRSAGATADDVLKITAYIVDVERWPRFNALYAEMMGNARPARTVVPVAQLHYGYLVEVDAIAVCLAELPAQDVLR